MSIFQVALIKVIPVLLILEPGLSMNVCFTLFHKEGLLIRLALVVKIFNIRTDPFRHLTLIYFAQA